VNNNFEGLDILSMSDIMSGPEPDWITKDFLAQVLQKEVGDNVTVIKFTTSPVVPPGNNYGSTIFRLKIEYSMPHQDAEESVSIIVKSELTGGPIKEVFNLTPVEGTFYYEFVPVAKRLIDMSFVPKSYNSPRPQDIILEDLKEQGFIMADRTKQLDYDQCRLYMTAAAKLHAVSVAVFKQRPELTNALGEEKIFKDDQVTADMFKTLCKYSFEMFIEETNKTERFKKYASLIKNTVPVLWDMIVKAHKPREGLKTINQGDPWVTNMMFKYNKQGSAIDIKLLDFQCLRYGTPVNDVVFFMWTSANNEVKKHHLKELYDIYLTTLNGHLEKLNCLERLTLEEFTECVNMLNPEALYWAGLPTIVYPEPVDFEMIQRCKETNNYEDMKIFFRKVFSDEYCTNVLPGLLESLEINGVFEYLKNI